MNTATQQLEPSTTSASKESRAATRVRSIDDARPEIGTDHETKALRITEADPAAGRDRGTSFLYYRGPFRVYFNRKEEAPRVVSIDNGSHAWEIVCKSVKVLTGDLRSTYAANSEYPNPAFTLEGYGAVTVDDSGNATIR